MNIRVTASVDLQRGFASSFFPRGPGRAGRYPAMVAASHSRRLKTRRTALRHRRVSAITDNAALTYFGSLTAGITDESKYALLAGAVAGDGLTVIANAANPAGATLPGRGFGHESTGALGLLLGQHYQPWLQHLFCIAALNPIRTWCPVQRARNDPG